MNDVIKEVETKYGNSLAAESKLTSELEELQSQYN